MPPIQQNLLNKNKNKNTVTSQVIFEQRKIQKIITSLFGNSQNMANADVNNKFLMFPIKCLLQEFSLPVIVFPRCVIASHIIYHDIIVWQNIFQKYSRAFYRFLSAYF